MEYILIAGIAIAVFVFLFIVIKVEKLRNIANALFLEMEKREADNVFKFTYACDKIYSYLPSVAKLFISEEFLRDIVQMLYDKTRRVARDLLDDGKWNKSV